MQDRARARFLPDMGGLGATGFAYRCLYPLRRSSREAAAAIAGRALRGTLLLPPVIHDRDAARLATRLLTVIRTGAPPLAAQDLLAALLTYVVGRHAVPRVEEVRLAGTGRALSRAHDLLASRLTENVTLDELRLLRSEPPLAALQATHRRDALCYRPQQRADRPEPPRPREADPFSLARPLRFT